jgi:sugar phosphate permease
LADIAGKRLAGTAAQLVNGFGFIGALVSGSAAGAVADESGWSGVFTTLSIVAAVSAVASMLYWVLDARAVAKRQANVVEIVAPTETTPLLS